MIDARSRISSVEVAVDPMTAFTVFTEEIGCWWIQGPINFYDSARAHGVRIEPGVGGRIVEVYDAATGDGLELGRIITWEPGVGLAWRSVLDDVEIDVRFEPTDGGTVVRVEATVPDGGADQGGTAWVRVTPVWFGDWIAKRDHVAHEPLRLSRLALGVHYTKPGAAARWLRDVFRLEPATGIPDADDEHAWIEFHVGTCSLMVFARAGNVDAPAPVTHTPWVFVDDLDEFYAHVTASGARILHGIRHHGARAFEAADLEGNHWTFAQAGPSMR